MKVTSAGRSRQVPITQGGMVLLLCLIFLTALTLLGLSAAADTVLQHKLATNLQESEQARQSASAALSWAETWLLELEGPAPKDCTEPCEGSCVHTAGSLLPHPEYESLSWWRTHGHEAGVDPLTGNHVATITVSSFNAPLWIIEKLHEIPGIESDATDLQVWYRILARGNGRTETGVSVVESTVIRSWASIDDASGPAPETTEPCPGTEPTTDCGRVSWRELR